MAQRLEGKKVAESVYSQILLDVSLLSVVPKLTVVLVGNDPASETYVRTKAKKCQSLGLQSETLHFPADVSEETLIQQIQTLNADPTTHGVLVQLPLPQHLNKHRIFEVLDPLKDVDGLTAANAGLLALGRPRFIPCTPLGVMEMLKFYGIDVAGKRAVILGRSDIVGKPMAQLLLNENATITVCHSRSRDVELICKEADVLVAALGKPKWVGPAMVKPGAVVIDVGIHRIHGHLCGDVDFEAVENQCQAISPVPGGVGPMTIAMLMKNLVLAASLQVKKKIKN
ncbi:bifunctional 5,10-methylenetetrahydrofolate dehydrogenase/5,10-methenyltetrahydrofolate cyclohydrolase [bacterium]|nr:bifunctional 5,10-methylenetetrahydrofolate dehydrogenase/5,10-methenyltetrahydrofolate cyclohydrolase [bacterium]